MPKATITLVDGTLITIDGTEEEVVRLLSLYGSGAKLQDRGTSEPVRKKTKTKSKAEDSGGSAPSEHDLATIVNLVHSVDEADAIEKQVLDQVSEVNRVLLPLYIISEHLGNGFGLTTTDIDRVTTLLGVRVTRQNALRSVKYSGSRYVTANNLRRKGNVTRYQLNRRGLRYFQSVLSGDASDQ